MTTTSTTGTGPGVPVRLVGSAAVALLGNLVVYGAGRLAGVDFDVVSFIGMRKETVGIQAIVVMTLVPWLLGSLLLLATRARSNRAWPVLAWVGAVLALVTVPFFNEATAATKITLAMMHLLTGALWCHTLTRRTRLLAEPPASDP